MKFKAYEVTLEIKPKMVFIAICFTIFSIAFVNVFFPTNFIIAKYIFSIILAFFVGMFSGLYFIYYSAKAGLMKSIKEV